MFGIGMPEMLLILGVALIVIGPKKLPDLAKSLGRAFGEFKKATNDLKESLDEETGYSEVTKTFDAVTDDIKSSVDYTVNDLETTPADSTLDAQGDGPASEAVPTEAENHDGIEETKEEDRGG